MMKASGRAAVILLAGLFVLFGGVAQAAPSSDASSKSDSAGKQADAGKQRRHTSRHRDSTKTAQKSHDKADKKDAAATTDEAKADNREVPASSQMPPEVANANAQLAADTPTAAAASAMTGRANDNVQAAADNTAAPNAESEVVAPDQLNDIDRALQQDNAPAQKVLIAATDAQPRPAPVMASSQQSSAWDQSSLIGKIFIGVGTLLTLASAARMFMA
jgi:cytoskeletal protein RodZ